MKGRGRITGRWPALAALLFASATVFPPAIAAAEGRLVILGSGHLAGRFAPALAKSFVADENLEMTDSVEDGRRVISGRQNGAAVLSVEIGASRQEDALRDLISGAADVVIVAAPADRGTPGPAAALTGLSEQLLEQPLAMETVAAIVAPDNPVAALSRRDLAAIFTGEAADWSAFGGAPGPITPYLSESAEAEGPASVMIGGGLAFGKTATRVPTEQDVVDAVLADPSAIGLVALPRAGSARPVPVALECGLVAEATPFTALAQEYPLSRAVLLYRRIDDRVGGPDRSQGQDAAARLAAFAGSDRARGVFFGSGMLNDDLAQSNGDSASLRLMSAVAAAQSDAELAALKQLREIDKKAERLSATFHFRGEGLLDPGSLARAETLAAWLMLPENRGRTLHLLGFDAEGGAGAEALQRSESLAEAVRRAILIGAPPGFDPATLQIAGFGAASPVACPDAPGGRRLNRRVEAWLTR